MALEHIRDEIRRKQAGLVTLGEAIANEIAAEAKSKASWTDRTGNTRNAIHGGVDSVGDEVVIYIAHGSEVGMYHETGTGIYGPKKRPITPTNAKVLSFKVNGQAVFARSVKGIKKNPVITNAAETKRPSVESAIKEYFTP